MNERIRELEAQCWETRQYGPAWFNSKKFAELVVQECVRQIAMIGISNFQNDDISWTVEKAIEDIHKHFGVEK